MLARLEFTGDDIPERQRQLAYQASLLKRAAEQFNLSVVVTNQVTAGYAGSGDRHEGAARGHRAALGLVWSHAVSTRIVMDQQKGQRRMMVRECHLYCICDITLPRHDMHLFELRQLENVQISSKSFLLIQLSYHCGSWAI
jgi:hypothetical protein